MENIALDVHKNYTWAQNRHRWMPAIHAGMTEEKTVDVAVLFMSRGRAQDCETLRWQTHELESVISAEAGIQSSSLQTQLTGQSKCGTCMRFFR